MENYILTAAGIIVSVALFIISYRQTIGAKKERISAANATLERTLLRRVVQENYIPVPQEIEILIDGFARDHRVNEGDLLSPSQVLNLLYTRIAASDLIHSEQRTEILDRVRQSIRLLEATPMPEERVEIQQAENLLDKRSSFLTLFLGITTSLAGTLVAAYTTFTSPTFTSVKQFINPEVLGVFVGSLIIILTIIYILKFRDRNEQPSRQTALQRTIDFEREVAKVLSRYGAKASMAASDSGYDFELDKDGKRILLEAKSWSHRVPLVIQKQIIDRLQDAMRIANADEAWLVVKDKSALPKEILGDGKIKLLSLDELRNKLSHNHR